MASRSGLSKSTIGRIWRKSGLRPHLADGFKLSTDPLFVEKVVDVVGLYHNPPDQAVVLCVDEKSGTRALDRSQPVLPMMPGMPERRSHDYARSSTTRLFAAFNIADGTGAQPDVPLSAGIANRGHSRRQNPQVRAKMSTSGPGWATMHRVSRRCSSVGRAAVL
jgi:hypothetical protein